MVALSSAPRVRFQIPVTSLRSSMAFKHAVNVREQFNVFAASLVPLKVDDNHTGDSFHCINAAKICEISQATRPRQYSQRTLKPDVIAENANAEASDEEDAANVYNAGCSMAYSDQDSHGSECVPQLLPGDEQAAKSHDAELHRCILAARKDGKLPLEIKINLLGSTSCYTEEELEQMAVSQQLRLVLAKYKID